MGRDGVGGKGAADAQGDDVKLEREVGDGAREKVGLHDGRGREEPQWSARESLELVRAARDPRDGARRTCIECRLSPESFGSSNVALATLWASSCPPKTDGRRAPLRGTEGQGQRDASLTAWSKAAGEKGGGTHCGWVPDDVSNQLGSAVRRKCSAGWMGYGGMAQGEVNEGR